MPISSLAQFTTLDERWLEFARCTQEIFEAYPYMLPIRQAVFKSLIEQRKTLSSTDQGKQWARFIVKRQHSTGDLSPVDIVFWLDSRREVSVEAILPIMKAVKAMGIRVALIAAPSVYHQLDSALNPIRFQVPYRKRDSAAWQRGWDALRAVYLDDLRREAYSAFCDLGYASDNAVQEIERLFTALRPRLLVLSADNLLPGSAACVGAKNLGIESLVLLHGAVSPYNTPVTASRMGVWGSVSQDQLEKLGVPADKLVILGSPRHDSFPAPLPPDVREQFHTALGLRDLPTLVFFSNGNDIWRNSREAVEGCAAWLNAAAAQFSEQMEFAVRLHPDEDGSLYANSPHLHVFKNECDLATTLGGADVCAALCSTTLVDALLYHKPILQFYADGWPDLADNWQRGLAHRIANPAQLVQFLAAGLQDKADWGKLVDQQSALIDSVFANSGHAGQAVVRYLIGQVEQTGDRKETISL